MNTKTKPIGCFITAIVAIYFLLFWETGNINHIRIPPWVFEDNCKNPKIMALVTRNMTGRNGPLLARAYDFLFKLIAGEYYFSTKDYLIIIDVNQNRIVYQIPDVKPDSLLLSNNGRWLLFVVNDTLYLNSLDKGIQKRISQNADMRLLDWTSDRNFALVEENKKIELVDISDCLNLSPGNCVIKKQVIIHHRNSCSSMVHYGKIINKESILLKYIDQNANVIDISGKNLLEIPDKECYGMEFDPIRKEFLLSCDHSLNIYSPSFELKSILNFEKDIYAIKRLQDGRRMIFISREDLVQYRLFDNTSERTFYPTRLNTIDENVPALIKPIYERTDERIGWIGLPGRDENCTLSQ